MKTVGIGFSDLTTVTFTNLPKCEHKNGWYYTVKFWIFSRRYFGCSDCGKQILQRKEK